MWALALALVVGVVDRKQAGSAFCGAFIVVVLVSCVDCVERYVRARWRAAAAVLIGARSERTCASGAGRVGASMQAICRCVVGVAVLATVRALLSGRCCWCCAGVGGVAGVGCGWRRCCVRLGGGRLAIAFVKASVVGGGWRWRRLRQIVACWRVVACCAFGGVGVGGEA